MVRYSIPPIQEHELSSLMAAYSGLNSRGGNHYSLRKRGRSHLSFPLNSTFNTAPRFIKVQQQTVETKKTDISFHQNLIDDLEVVR